MNQGNDLADWLQEAARRDAQRRHDAPAAAPAQPPAVPRPARRASPASRRIAAIGGLSLAYLQYYFVGVMTEIYSLSSLVVFLPYTTLD